MSNGRTGAISLSERRRLARFISQVENGAPDVIDRIICGNLRQLPYIVGVTGPSGAGKSLLISKLIHSFHQTKSLSKGRLGVIAVDPTCPITGGALLGDRARMVRLPPNVFFRSIATRGASGGISDRLIDMTVAMKLHGIDVLFIETIGVGQDELSVRHVADTIVAVEAPGFGDYIQAMKASPLSIADIVVVNKADLAGASGTASVIADTRGIRPYLTSAIDGRGIPELTAEIFRKKKVAMSAQTKAASDRRKILWRLMNELSKTAESCLQNDISADFDKARTISDVYRCISGITRYRPDHVAIAVANIESAVETFRKIGFYYVGEEEIVPEKVKAAFFSASGFHIELIQPTQNDSPIARFVAERGGGLHHVAFQVDGIGRTVEWLDAHHIERIGEPRVGAHGKRIIFLHPKFSCRCLIEFCEHTPPHHNRRRSDHDHL